jgi:hypothetical protein
LPQRDGKLYADEWAVGQIHLIDSCEYALRDRRQSDIGAAALCAQTLRTHTKPACLPTIDIQRYQQASKQAVFIQPSAFLSNSGAFLTGCAGRPNRQTELNLAINTSKTDIDTTGFDMCLKALSISSQHMIAMLMYRLEYRACACLTWKAQKCALVVAVVAALSKLRCVYRNLPPNIITVHQLHHRYRCLQPFPPTSTITTGTTIYHRLASKPSTAKHWPWQPTSPGIPSRCTL